MNTSKKWSLGFLLITLALLVFFGGMTAVIDPYFHYGRPKEDLEYPIYDERYQNDGIVKHFAYDALITGTSLTQNFRTSQLNELFGVNAIKVPFAGSTYKEIDANLRRAIKANPELKMVVRCLDGYMLYEDKDAMRTDATYPDYLYDDNLFNDVQYVLNKSIFFDSTMYVLDYTRQGNVTTSFDDYANWSASYDLGTEIALSTAEWPFNDWSVEINNQPITAEMETALRENLRQNVLAVVEENPDIQFYLYFPPYSSLWWGEIYRNSTLMAQVDCYRITTEILLEYDNVRLFSFSNDFDVTMDLENYKDNIHYSEKISTRIISDMHQGNYELTKENYKAHWDEVYEFYSTYPYESYFAQITAGLSAE